MLFHYENEFLLVIVMIRLNISFTHTRKKFWAYQKTADVIKFYHLDFEDEY